MKIDLYTKGILTIIAISLGIIAARDLNVAPTAYAQSRSDMQAAISYCWDLATIQRQTERQWQIHTYC